MVVPWQSTGLGGSYGRARWLEAAWNVGIKATCSLVNPEEEVTRIEVASFEVM